MRSATIKACFLGGLICLSGCSSVRNGFAGSAADRPARPAGVEVLHAAAESPFEPASTSFPADRNQAVVADDVDSAVLRTPGESPAVDVVGIERPRRQPPSSATPRKLVVTPVGHEIADDRPESDGMITVDGRTYEIRLVDQQTQAPLTEAGFRNVRVASQQIALSET
ncbi:MAG: hypothetical protein ABGZ24_20905, partial [Fuerstiella sp.]